MSEPDSDEALTLYDAARAAPFNVPSGFADGDVALSRPAGGGGGGDIVVFDVIHSVARTGDGEPIQILSDNKIESPEGEVLCTRANVSGFVQLRDTDGTVLLSSMGPFVFEGQPNLAGKNPVQQGLELANHLRFSFQFEVVVEGFAASGEDMVTASVPVQFSSSWRKLVIASLIDGYCGSDGLPE